MDENELEVMDDIETQENKEKKSPLIAIGVGLIALAFVGILAGGIVGGTKYLVAKGIIEEPEFLRAIGASDYDVEELSGSASDISEYAEDRFGNGDSGIEGSLFGTIDDERTAAEAALDGKDESVLNGDGSSSGDEDFDESEDKKDDDKDKDKDKDKDTSDAKDNDGKAEEYANKSNVRKSGTAQRNSRISAALSAYDIGMLPLIPGQGPFWINPAPYGTSSGSSGSSSSGSSSGSSSDSSSGSSSSGSSSGSSTTPTPTAVPTVVPTPTVTPTPTADPTPIPTPTPIPSAINAKATVATLEDAEDYAYTIESTKTDTKKRWSTVMIYLCGTDLEDNNGLATDAIVNMLSSQYNTELVNVIICAGGTKNWGNDYMGSATATESKYYGKDTVDNDNDEVKIYYLNNSASLETGSVVRTATSSNVNAVDKTSLNAGTLELIGSYSATDMGDPKLLAGFINMATENFPASSYDLILWNHGSGVVSGVCKSDSTDDVTGTCIETWELEDALRSTNLYLSGEKLDIIGFDACLMESMELAYNLSPYCNYMIGSEEETFGNWDYRSILASLSSKDAYNWSSSAVTGLKSDSAKTIANYYYLNNIGDNKTMETIACVDLSEIGDLTTKVNAVSNNILTLWQYTEDTDSGNSAGETASAKFQADCYQAYKQARIHSLSFGASEKGRDEAGDYVDIQDFLNNLSKYFGQITTSNSTEKKLITDITDSIKAAIEELDAVIASGVTFNNASMSSSGMASQGSFGKASTTSTTSAIWSDFNGAVLSGISVYVPYYSLSNYASYVNEEDNTVTYYDMDILDDFTALSREYAKIASSDAEVSRIKRLASVIDYGKMFENATSDYAVRSDKTGYITDNTIYGSAGFEYLTVKFKEDYDEGDAPVAVNTTGDTETTVEVSSGDPFTDFMDTIDSVNVIVTATLGSGDSQKTYEMGMQSVGLGTIQGSNETISVLTSLVAEAVSKVKERTVYYLTSTDSSSGTAVTTKESFVDAIDEDNNALIIRTLIKELNKSRSDDNKLDEETTSNYAIFSGRYVTTTTETKEVEITKTENGVVQTDENGNPITEKSTTQVSTDTTSSDYATHIFSFDESGNGTYLGSFVNSESSDSGYALVDASTTKIEFIETVIKDHGVEFDDSVKVAVADFASAYMVCRAAISDIGDDELGYTLDLESIAGIDQNGNETEAVSYIFSDDIMSVSTLPATTSSTETSKSGSSQAGDSSGESSSSSGGGSGSSSSSAGETVTTVDTTSDITAVTTAEENSTTETASVTSETAAVTSSDTVVTETPTQAATETTAVDASNPDTTAGTSSADTGSSSEGSSGGSSDGGGDNSGGSDGSSDSSSDSSDEGSGDLE